MKINNISNQISLIKNKKRQEYFNKINNTIETKDKFKIINYNKPDKEDTAVLIVFYNFTKSNRIIQNLLLVKYLLEKAKIPYYIGELAYGETEFFFKGENIFHYRTNSYMFYKENLINITEEKIPQKYTKIITMDSDILFNNPNWYNIISSKLEETTICQCFRVANWLSLDYKIFHKKDSIINDNSKGHPGFIWGFQREWLNKYKLFDKCLIGGGDTEFVLILLKKKNDLFNNYIGNINKTYENKIENTYNLSNVNLEIFHLYHGSFNNRQYIDRHEILNNIINQKNLNNIDDLISKNENELYEWKDEYKMEINKMLYNYFINRDDDSL